MKKVVIYLFVVSVIYISLLACVALKIYTTPKIEMISLILKCAFIGGLGGCIYCFRGVYVNFSVKNRWRSRWEVWYYIRPFVSAICGGVSFLFLQAGLLVLESGVESEASRLGFYAFAFIAGFNVDNFLKKLESISEAIWGIKKSRAGSDDKTKKPKGNKK